MYGLPVLKPHAAMVCDDVTRAMLEAGFALLFTGAAVTTVGFIVFGKSFRPAVHVAPEDAAAARVNLGFGPARVSLGGCF